jgi:hypothetical protein
MNRDEAAAMVAPYVQRIDQYQGVAICDVVMLLGAPDAKRLKADRIRSLGPKPGFVYPWNVVDYLTTLQSIGGT